MNNTDKYYKANLAEEAYKYFWKYMLRAFRDYNRITNRDKILFYCFMNKAISDKQIEIMFVYNDYNEKKAIEMVLQRMSKQKLIKKFKLSNDETGYCITFAGISKCKEKIKQLNSKVMEGTIYENNNTLDNIINYLAEKCINTKPVYWQHYLAIRDIYTYMLSDSFHFSALQFDPEVAIDSKGTIASLYTKSLYGIDLNCELRCDAMIKFKYDISENDNFFNYLIELDTGSQKSSILVDKIKKYIMNYVDTNAYTLDTSLIFSIDTNVTNDIKKSYKKNLSIKDYQYAFAFRCVHDMYYNICIKDNMKFLTINDMLSIIKVINKNVKHPSESLEKLCGYVESKSDFFNPKWCVMGLNDTYNADLKKDVMQKNNTIKSLHSRRYNMRKLLLYRSVKDIPGLNAAFLRGFSLYTVDNYNLDNTLRYLRPNNGNVGYAIIKKLIDNKILYNNKPTYKSFIKMDTDYKVLRNFYYFDKINLAIIIENISDDLGGYFRIINLLENDSIPTILLNTKVLCMCDENNIDEIKTKYLNTKYGKILSAKCFDYITDGFEVLFICYKDIFSGGDIFSFSADGKIVYKTKYNVIKEEGANYEKNQEI